MMQTVEFTTVGNQVASVLKRYPIAKAAIFGSFARINN